MRCRGIRRLRVAKWHDGVTPQFWSRAARQCGMPFWCVNGTRTLHHHAIAAFHAGAVAGLVGIEGKAAVAGHRHGSRTRSLVGTFGPTEIEVPRARLDTADGKTTEWRSSALRAYQRRTLAADALIASTYLAGTNTRRVRRALAALFDGTVGKDTVSRTWRKVKSDWDAWNTRSLAEEPVVRLILDGTVVRVRLDRKATSISLLVVLG